MALNCFLPQKSVFRATRGRKRKRYQISRKSTDENDHSQTGQGEEIATPPAQSTNPRRERPEELTQMNPSNPLQSELEIIYSSSFVPIDRVAKPLPNAAQTLEDQHCEEPESQQPCFDCLTQALHRQIRLYPRRLEAYSNEAHLSTVMAAIQYSEFLPDTNLQNKEDFSPYFEGKDDDSYLLLWNHTKAPIISKYFLRAFLRALPYCPIIHWESQTCNNPKFVFVHVQFIPNYGGKK